MNPTEEQLKNRITATGQQPVPQPVQPPQASELSPLQNPVPASSLTPAQNINLPEQRAPEVQAQFVTSIAADVKNARTALEGDYKSRLEAADKRLEALRGEEKTITDQQGELSQPFREQLENTERERLYITENFEANQKLVRELDTLLTEGNEMIRGERNRFASRSSIASGMARTMDDVNARAGVINAVISSRNGQIAQAYTMIDRSVAAISADRKDKLAYYDTLLSLNNQKQLSLDKESKAIVEEQTALLRGDLQRAEKTAEAIKQAMIDPDTALAYAEAGVTLLDTPEEISEKLAGYGYAKEVRDLGNEMAAAGYATVVPGQTPPFGSHVVTMTDSKGTPRQYYAKPTTSGGRGGGAPSSGSLIPSDTPDYILEVIRNSRGGGKLTGSQTIPLSKASIVLSQVQELAATIQSTNTDPILGILRDNNPYDVKARLLTAQLRSTVPNLARGIYGEVGVLTDADIANYIQTLPNIRTPEEANKLVLSMTIKTIMNSVGAQLETLAASGRDVSGFENIYTRMKETADSLVPPPEAPTLEAPYDPTELDDIEFTSTPQLPTAGFAQRIRSFFGL